MSEHPRIRVVWPESSLGTFSIAKNANILHADNGDSDQIARMGRLIYVSVGPVWEKANFQILAKWRKRII